MCDQLLKDRKIRIDISTNTSQDRNNRGFGGNRMDNRHREDDGGEDRTAGDWRSGSSFRRDDDNRRDRYEPPRDNRGGGGFDRYERRDNYDRGNLRKTRAFC